MSAQIVKHKLYFNFAIGPTFASPNTTRQIFPCTQITAGTPGDRNGCLLQSMLALTGGASAAKKAQAEVSAWAQIVGDGTFGGTRAAGVLIDFIGPTSGAGTGSVTQLPYLKAGSGGTSADATFAGASAIYSITAGLQRHFSVRVRKFSALISTQVVGVLYVARQHSIEV